MAGADDEFHSVGEHFCNQIPRLAVNFVCATQVNANRGALSAGFPPAAFEFLNPLSVEFSDNLQGD